MKRLLTLSVIMVAVAALCVPASAQYAVNWGTGFEQGEAPPAYVLGPLVPQDGWTLASGTSPNIVTPMAQTGAQSAEQAVGASMAGKNLTGLAGGNVYKNGWAKFWLYDPGDIPDGAGGFLQTDGRVAIQSSVGGSSVSTTWSANVTTNRSQVHWTAQWSWSPVVMDGVAAPSGAGYTFTAGLPALRSVGWNYVILSWVFTYVEPNGPGSGGTGQVQWRVNQTGMTPNLTLNFDSTSGRWANSHEVAGVAMHSPYGCVTQTYVDDIEFHGNPVPEPSSLLALGTGLIGIVGVIRRRR